MASMKLEDLELWQELNEHELEVVHGGDSKSVSRKENSKEPVITNVNDLTNIEGLSLESKRRLYCALTSTLWHFC